MRRCNFRSTSCHSNTVRYALPTTARCTKPFRPGGVRPHRCRLLQMVLPAPGRAAPAESLPPLGSQRFNAGGDYKTAPAAWLRSKGPGYTRLCFAPGPVFYRSPPSPPLIVKARYNGGVSFHLEIPAGKPHHRCFPSFALFNHGFDKSDSRLHTPVADHQSSLVHRLCSAPDRGVYVHLPASQAGIVE